MRSIKLLLSSSLIFICHLSFGQWQGVGGKINNSAFYSQAADIAIHPITQEPYVLYSSGGVMKWDGVSWDSVGVLPMGNTYYGVTSDLVDLEFDPVNAELYVAYRNASGVGPSYMNVKKFDGNNWVQVGPANFSNSSINTPSIKFHPTTNEPYVCYYDQSFGFFIKKYDGAQWVTMWSDSLSTYYIDMEFDQTNDNLYVCYRQSTSGKISVEEYDGSTWTNVGPAEFSNGQIAYCYIALHPITNEIYVAYNEYLPASTSNMKKWDGSNWVNIDTSGIVFSNGTLMRSFAFNPVTGNPYCLTDQDPNQSNKASVRYFDGEWKYVGSNGASYGACLENLDIAFNNKGELYLGYVDNFVPYGAYASKYGLPTATFQANSTTGFVGQGLTFTSSSAGITSWQWSFPGATPSASSDEHPSGIEYSTSGDYSVQLIVTNSVGSDTILYSNYITILDSTGIPNANFTYSNGILNTGDSIDFFDASSNNPTAWNWSFPGGTPSFSTLQNPSNIVYDSTGTFDVLLSVSTASGNDYELKAQIITVGSGQNTALDTLNYPLNGTISMAPFGSGWIGGNNSYGDIAKSEFFSGISAQSVISAVNIDFIEGQFVNANSEIILTVWDDDGTSNSPNTVLYSQSVLISEIADDVANARTTEVTLDSPLPISGDCYIGIQLSTQAGDTVGIYMNSDGDTNPGTAWEQWNTNAWHSIASAWGQDRSFAIFPVIYTSESPNADFSASINQIFEGQSLNFFDFSTNNPTSWNWSFEGASVAGSTLKNPIGIRYDTAGTYQVKLICSNNEGTDSLTRSGYVEVSAIPVNAPISNFMGDNVSILVNESVNFSDLTANGPLSWKWEFEGGNPSQSIDQNPSSISYSTAGTYDVTLITTNNGGSDTLVKQNYIAVGSIGAINSNMEAKFQTKIVPNPNSGMFELHTQNFKSVYQINIYNSIGELILIEKNVRQPTKTIALSGFESGIYLIELQSGQTRITRKMIIE